MMPPISSIHPVLRKVLRVALLIALFMAMAGAGAYLALTLIVKGEEPVVVPDLVGKDVLYSLEILSDLGLNTRVRGTVYHEQVPKNHVIDQDPEPGASIKRGRDVKIRVSRGPERIVMPNLTGLSLQQSRILLTENGLCQGSLATVTDSRMNKGQVMAQHPLPGATVARDGCADLLISSGPRSFSFPMPDLSGQLFEKTLRRLEALQLDVGDSRNTFRPGSPLETVVEQTPSPGYRVAAGIRADLTVNRRQTTSPNGNREPSNGFKLFRYTLENGFLNKRVTVTVDRPQGPIHLFDDFVSPGQEIWLLIPKSDTSSVQVYVDGQLMKSPSQTLGTLIWP
ncbi:PASTA domain-containing protein [uncultured Desulfosarcina sp.]|uniref:PASTA domain-containing protein n=1 Tax=uncultured Desulfosarcina sp. TaxID=218289 RepID=UPI0029C988EB|nr:PASTA domain-containing protein [uncultured Desulfosarcina sp.]